MNKYHTYPHICKEDVVELLKLDFKDYKVSRKALNSDKILNINGQGPIEVGQNPDFEELKDVIITKRDILRIMRHAVAHGLVEVIKPVIKPDNKPENYDDDPNNIKLLFRCQSPTAKETSEDRVVVTVGNIMKTFTSPVFNSPTKTKISGH